MRGRRWSTYDAIRERAPDGGMVEGSYELVEWAVRVAQVLGREPATPDEAREIMGLRGA